MSKQSYINGFCKKAAECGVDPVKLAKYHEKKAFSWADVKAKIDQGVGAARDAWHNVPDEYKPLVGGLAGASAGGLLGAGVGGITGFGAGKGALTGAALGGFGGTTYGMNARRLGDLARAEEKRLGDLAMAEQRRKWDLEAAKDESDKTLKDTETMYGNKLKDLETRLKSNGAESAKALQDLVSKHKGEMDASQKALAASKAEGAKALAKANRQIKALQKLLSNNQADAEAKAEHISDLESIDLEGQNLVNMSGAERLRVLEAVKAQRDRAEKTIRTIESLQGGDYADRIMKAFGLTYPSDAEQ